MHVSSVVIKIFLIGSNRFASSQSRKHAFFVFCIVIILFEAMSNRTWLKPNQRTRFDSMAFVCMFTVVVGCACSN